MVSKPNRYEASLTQGAKQNLELMCGPHYYKITYVLSVTVNHGHWPHPKFTIRPFLWWNGCIYVTI